jgi:hypothetical protein
LKWAPGIQSGTYLTIRVWLNVVKIT